MNIEFFNQRQAGFRVQTGRRQEFLTDGLAQLIHIFIALEALMVKDNAAHEGIAVGMYAGRRQAENHIALFYLGAGDELALFHHTYGKTGNIVFPFGIKAVHLCRFAANQGAAGFLAGACYTGYDIGHLFRQELAHRQIVEEEQGFCPLHQNIVDAHGHGILTDGIVLIEHKGQFKFRAHAVRTGYQHRLLVLAAV